MLNGSSDNINLILDRCNYINVSWDSTKYPKPETQKNNVSVTKKFPSMRICGLFWTPVSIFSQKWYPRLYPKHVAKRLEVDHSGAVNDSVFLNESLKWTNRSGSLPCTESNVFFVEVSPLLLSCLTHEPTEVDCDLWGRNIIGWVRSTERTRPFHKRFSFKFNENRSARIDWCRLICHLVLERGSDY